MKEINVSVPLTDVNRYLRHMNDLLKAHFELIRLFEVETKLKKHHRAYLHVRERIDQIIEETAPHIAEIAADIAAVMKTGYAADIIETDEAEDCESCACFECDGDCLSCKESPCDDGRDEDDEYPFAEADTPASSGYLFEDTDIVMMSKKDFDIMLDDVLTLAELVEMVTEMRTHDMEFIQKHAHQFPAFAAYERNRLRIYKEANAEADAILDRWDDADFGEAHHMTVELR